MWLTSRSELFAVHKISTIYRYSWFDPSRVLLFILLNLISFISLEHESSSEIKGFS